MFLDREFSFINVAYTTFFEVPRFFFFLMYDSVVSSLPTVASIIRNNIELRGMQGPMESGDDRDAVRKKI